MDWIIMKFFYFGVKSSPLSSHRSVVHQLSEAGLLSFQILFIIFPFLVVTSFSESVWKYFLGFFFVNLLPPHFS